MGLTDAFMRLLDPYDRQARLYPALLVLAPMVTNLLLLHGGPSNITTMTIGVLASFGLLYWLAQLARERGRQLEPGLFASWGGKPSVRMLRHRDAAIDPVTKARYHRLLSVALSVNAPTAADELANPKAADHFYESATRWLLERTRDTTRFGLLFAENIGYGFRRNLLGLKPVGLLVSVASLLWSVAWCLFFRATTDGSIVSRALGLEVEQVAAITINGALAAMWLFAVKVKGVKASADAYALRLLAATELISASPAEVSKSTT